MKNTMEVISNLTELQRITSFAQASTVVVVYMSFMSIISCYFNEFSHFYKDNKYLEIGATLLSYSYTPLLIISLVSLIGLERIPTYDRT